MEAPLFSRMYTEVEGNEVTKCAGTVDLITFRLSAWCSKRTGPHKRTEKNMADWCTQLRVNFVTNATIRFWCVIDVRFEQSNNCRFISCALAPHSGSNGRLSKCNQRQNQCLHGKFIVPCASTTDGTTNIVSINWKSWIAKRNTHFYSSTECCNETKKKEVWFFLLLFRCEYRVHTAHNLATKPYKFSWCNAFQSASSKLPRISCVYKRKHRSSTQTRAKRLNRQSVISFISFRRRFCHHTTFSKPSQCQCLLTCSHVVYKINAIW